MPRRSPAPQTTARFAVTLAADLERRRLEMGIERAQRALSALHRLAEDRRRQAGTAPRQIARAIADFESQIAEARTRMTDIVSVEDRWFMVDLDIEYSAWYEGDEAAITLVAPAFRASYALAGSLHASGGHGVLAGAYILLTDGSDEPSREGWAAKVLQTGLFHAASRYRIIDGLSEPPEWLEVFETDQADPLTAYQRALDALAPRLPAADIRPRTCGCFRRTSRNGWVGLPTT